MKSDIAAAPPGFDPSDPAIIQNLRPALVALQARDPAHWSPAPRSWPLARHADVSAAPSSPLKSVDRIDPRRRAMPEAARAALAGIVRRLRERLAFSDPPRHARRRAPMAAAFAREAAEGLRPNVEAIADGPIAAPPRGEPVDFVARCAMPPPAMAIMDPLGGPRDAMDQVKAWSDDMRLFIGAAPNTPRRNARASTARRAPWRARRRPITFRAAGPCPRASACSPCSMPPTWTGARSIARGRSTSRAAATVA